MTKEELALEMRIIELKAYEEVCRPPLLCSQPYAPRRVQWNTDATIAVTLFVLHIVSITFNGYLATKGGDYAILHATFTALGVFGIGQLVAMVCRT